jgi:hypothetical protein
MRILAFLTDPPVVSAILLHLDLPPKPPPLSPARGPPQSDLLTGLLDQTPAFDPAEPEPVPDFDFDRLASRMSGSDGCVLCGSRPTDDSWALLLDFEWLFALTDFLGVTSYTFVDINGVESFGGLTLGLYLGRF